MKPTKMLMQAKPTAMLNVKLMEPDSVSQALISNES